MKYTIGKTAKRISSLIFFSFLIGLIFNQFHSDGIRWHMLIPQWLESGNASQTIFHVLSPDSVFNLLNEKKVGILDIRDSRDYRLDHIINADNIPYKELLIKDHKTFINQKELWIIYDESGNMSKLQEAARNINRSGNKSVYLIFGGYMHWLEKELPIETGGIR